MAQRPFLCGKCGNWYIPVPPKENEPQSCYSCDEGIHFASPGKNIDCHFGQQSATPSEIRMAGVIETCKKAVTLADSAVEKIGTAKDLASVKALLATAERAFSDAEKAQKEVANIQEWAGVMEMPGEKGSDPKVRFKSIEAIEELVKTNRRPQTDLTMLRRSIKVCKEMSDEVPELVTGARVSVGQARHLAIAWTPAATPVTSDTTRSKRSEIAKKRWAEKKAKEKTLVPA